MRTGLPSPPPPSVHEGPGKLPFVWQDYSGGFGLLPFNTPGLGINVEQTRGQNGAQWVKCLQHKQENPCKRPGVLVCAGEAETQRSPGVHWPTSLAFMVNSRLMLLSQKTRYMVPEEWHPKFTSSLCTDTYTYTHTQTYTCTHIHTWTHTCTHKHTYICICTHECLYTCHTCIYVHTHVYACMCVCV